MCVEQDIGWLNVTMDHALLVYIVNGQADRSKKRNDVSARRKLTGTRCFANKIC